MPGHADILDERDSLKGPLAGSVLLHVLLFSSIVVYSIAGRRHRELWGDPNAMGGGSMGVNIVKQIPLPPRSGRINPVANDTESAVPQPPAPAKPKPQAKAPEPDAIEIRGKTSKREPQPQPTGAQNRWRAQQQERPNQVYSSSGEALVSPMQGMTGSGGIGIGTGTFGNRFGGYVDLLRQRVGEKWRTGEIDARIKTAPPVIVTFTIQRSGETRDVRVAQSSGNVMLDRSALRAIADASPLPPLPPGYERDSATIEFQFFLRR